MSVNKLKDGRWITQYEVTLPNGQKKQVRKYFGRGDSGELKAKANHQEFIASKSDVHIKGIGLSLAELIKGYQEEKFLSSGGMSYTDQMNTSYKFEKLILPFFKNIKALQIDDDLVSEYIKTRLNSWADKKKTRKVKATTVHREISILRAVLNWAVNHNPPLIAYNPIAKLKMPKRDDACIPPPTDEELRRILQAAPPHLKRAVILCIYTGARAGFEELLQISWEFQDLERNVVTIFSAKKSGDADILYRRIPIDDELIELLKKWKQEDLELLVRKTARLEKKTARQRVAVPNGNCKKSSNLSSQLTLNDVIGPIVNYRGKPIKSYKRAWGETLKRAKIHRRLRPYDTRHYFATKLAEGGVGVKTVAELLGNHPDTATRYYIHSNAGYKQKAVEILPTVSSLLDNPKKEEGSK